jgi:hypothetical protein
VVKQNTGAARGVGEEGEGGAAIHSQGVHLRHLRRPPLGWDPNEIQLSSLMFDEKIASLKESDLAKLKETTQEMI